MLNKKEQEIIMLLLEDLTKSYTIREISLIQKQKYPQTHRLINILKQKDLLEVNQIGQSKVISLKFQKENLEIVQAEIERTNNWKQKNKELKELPQKISSLHTLCCILFGSQTKTKKTSSDIDLLFIIPNDTDKNIFERQAKNTLALYDIDFNIIYEKNFKEMLFKRNELNVANEIIKNHIILTGYDYFVSLMRRQYD